MDYFTVVLIIIAFATAYAAKVGYVHAMRRGRFGRFPLGSESVRLDTDFGSIKIDAVRKAIELRPKSGPVSSVPFAQITGIKFRANTEAALINEYLRGFDLWDIFLAYRDTKQSFSINLVKSDSTEIPLFWATQCESREPLMIGIYFEQWLTSVLNFRRADDFPGYCRGIYERILADAKAAGMALRIM